MKLNLNFILSKIAVIYLLLGVSTPMFAYNEIRVTELINSLQITGPFTIKQLSGGLSGSEIIKVSTPNRDYVVRFWNMQWADYFPQDLACQLVASDAGYGPKVYFRDAVEGITVMEYYFPEPLPEIQIRLATLVSLLKKIHTGPSVPKGIDRSIYLDLLIEEIKESNFVDLQAIKTIKNTVFAHTRPHALHVPCHRDLHHGNLIYTQGKYVAIDYTWGAMDDPYADLANIAIFNCSTIEEEKLLLQLYLGRPPSFKEVARLSLMKLPAKIFYGLEFLGIASTSKTNLSMTQEKLPTSYMDFGSDTNASHPNNFLNYAVSLLSEVIHYSQSEQYVKDLEEVSSQYK